MAFHYLKPISVLIIIFVVLGVGEVLAMRPLEGEQWLNNKGLAFQSLQRGPVPSSGSSPCTYIPGGGHGRCTLAENEINFPGHGHVAHAPPAFPNAMVEFGTADKPKQ